MITSATITATEAPPTALAVPSQARGALDYPVDGWDLVDFGRSPDRWVHTPKPEKDDKPDLSELVRMLHLTPQLAPAHYVTRPATYQAMFLTCPSCGSTSSAKICRSCNLPRVNTTETKPWTGTAKYCLAWTQDAVRRGLRIVSESDWAKATAAVARLNADSEISDLANQSSRQIVLSGIWHDADTGLDIPLRSLLAYAPAGGRSHDDMLGSLSITRDASHTYWAGSAYSRGQHIVAALKHDLYAAATNDPRPTHVWVIVERDAPHILGRRRTTPEMLVAGRTALDALLGAYARCLKTGNWPAFDPLVPGSEQSWSPFALESWMTQGDGRAASYFGVTAANGLAARN